MSSLHNNCAITFDRVNLSGSISRIVQYWKDNQEKWDREVYRNLGFSEEKIEELTGKLGKQEEV